MMNDKVLNVITRLGDAGFSAFLVGGAVRDMLMGIEPHDFDVATSAKPDEVVALLGGVHNNRFGTVLVDDIEVTTFRKDGESDDHRRPTFVTFDGVSLTDDLARRDFTINAMAIEKHGILIDPFGGARDLNDRIIRFVGNPVDRINEDALRMLRAVRFSGRFGFDIDSDTFQAIVDHASDLNFVASERLGTELMRMLDDRSAVSMLAAFGLLREILPGARAPLVMGSHRVTFASMLRDVETNIVHKLINRLALGDDLARDVEHLLDAMYLSTGTTPADMRFFISRVGREFVSDVLTLQGKTHLQSVVDIEINQPLTIGELALNGTDLLRIGIKGKAIGETLNHLLALVVDDPSLNTAERLLERV